MTITLNHYMVVSFLLFSIGFMGVLVRRNFLTILMSVELMLNAVNLNLIAFSRRLSDLTGQVFSIFVITIAAGEAAIGLALTISFFRHNRTNPRRKESAALQLLALHTLASLSQPGRQFSLCEQANKLAVGRPHALQQALRRRDGEQL